MLGIKSGVNGAIISGLRPEALLGIIIVNDVFRAYGLDCIITEITGGEHSKHSRHKVGLAVDFRNWNIPEEKQSQIFAEILRSLGDNYDLVDEGNHWHLEFDPER